MSADSGSGQSKEQAVAEVVVLQYLENVRQKEVKEGKPRKPLDVDAIVPSLKETNEILTIVIRAKLEIEVEKKLAQMVPDRKYGPTLALIHDNNVGGFVARSTSDHTFYYFGAIPIGANITSNGAGGKDLFQFIGNLNLKDPQTEKITIYCTYNSFVHFWYGCEELQGFVWSCLICLHPHLVKHLASGQDIGEVVSSILKFEMHLLAPLQAVHKLPNIVDVFGELEGVY